jgi:transcriptional regulator with XRE-family HTH domain
MGLVGMPGTGIGDYIAQLRKRNGLTQKQLAEAAGLSSVAIAQIEQGRRSRPTRDTLLPIAAALGVRYIDLLVGAGEVDAAEVELPPPMPPELERLYAEVRQLSPLDLRVFRLYLDAFQGKARATRSEGEMTTVLDALQQGGMSKEDADRMMTELIRVIGRWADARVMLAKTNAADAEAEHRFQERDAALRDLNTLLGRDMHV